MGWAFINPPDEDARVLEAFASRVPAQWKTDNKGRRDPNARQSFHITFATPLNSRGGRALRTALSHHCPVHARWSAPLIEKVGRITAADVYCLILSVDSGELRQLREETARECNTAPPAYDGAGHVSIVYVTADHAGELRQMLDADASLTALVGHTLAPGPDTAAPADEHRVAYWLATRGSGAEQDASEESKLRHDDECNIERWYECLRRWTYETAFVEVSQEQAREILSRKPASTFPSLRELARRVEAAIRVVGGHAFVRLSSRSPKDAAFTSPEMKTLLSAHLERMQRSVSCSAVETQNMEFAAFFQARAEASMVSNGRKALQLLRHSERVREDLSRSLRHADAVPWTVVAAVRRWDSIPVWSEFRGFVRDRSLVAISQYNFAVCFEREVVARSEGIRKTIVEFFERSGVKEALPLADCVADFVVPDDLDPSGVRLLEINPWATTTSPCLFTWLPGAKDLEGLEPPLPAMRVVAEPLPVLRDNAAFSQTDALLRNMPTDVVEDSQPLLEQVQSFLSDDVERINSTLRYTLSKCYGRRMTSYPI
eukprot:m51a1_g3767 hypothetical protein (545) ;mRNA; f:127392-129172